MDSDLGAELGVGITYGHREVVVGCGHGGVEVHERSMAKDQGLNVVQERRVKGHVLGVSNSDVQQSLRHEGHWSKIHNHRR